ncbi:MAG: hypothetical protein K6T73_03355 [Candidatus Bathyarchaeota archaeon]|nr:hypothetical protein [Candidatus Bathyarchaeota archaeon]
MAAVSVKRCGEELDEIRKLLSHIIDHSISYAQYEHECDVHEMLEFCTARDVQADLIEAHKKELEEAFDNLAKCLGRIAKE